MASSSRWLVGSSSSRQAGRVVITVAIASRVRCPPDSVPTSRAGSRAPSPSSWAATSARRSASQASWSTACSRAAAYAAWPASSSEVAGQLLDAPARPRAAASASPRAPRRWCGRRGTAAPGRAAPGRSAPRACRRRGPSRAVGLRRPAAGSTCRCRSPRPGRSAAPAGRPGRRRPARCGHGTRRRGREGRRAGARDDRHAAVLTKKRDSPGAEKSGWPRARVGSGRDPHDASTLR